LTRRKRPPEGPKKKSCEPSSGSGDWRRPARDSVGWFRMRTPSGDSRRSGCMAARTTAGHGHRFAVPTRFLASRKILGEFSPTRSGRAPSGPPFVPLRRPFRKTWTYPARPKRFCFPSRRAEVKASERSRFTLARPWHSKSGILRIAMRFFRSRAKAGVDRLCPCASAQLTASNLLFEAGACVHVSGHTIRQKLA